MSAAVVLLFLLLFLLRFLCGLVPLLVLCSIESASDVDGSDDDDDDDDDDDTGADVDVDVGVDNAEVTDGFIENKARSGGRSAS